MLQKLIELSVRNKLVAFMLAALIAIAGLFSASDIPLDAVPDITNNQVQVITQAPTLATQEVEQLVTTPMERTLANIPGQIELRSISRFGLSVITVVFSDDVDQYRARQLVQEQLITARQELAQLASPELAPMTTGLGEIFQYYLEVSPEFENYYSLQELRTIQDWVIKRQLAGIPGVVDISSFGGKSRQIQIALNPAQLRQMNISVKEIQTSIADANANEGGGYLEKNGRIYLVRSEGLLKNLDELRSIVIAVKNGNPVLLHQVATVLEGSAPRYGALTANGKGEKTGGIILMKKGANSAKVITDVKHRIAEIQRSLPAGVKIHAFLDRSKLVNKAIHTVATNLGEGGIIVMLVLLLLLGDWRASLIVASVIPLSLFFALTCMRIFGVSANLMSLGAIDFGLVVDGSVIVVESAVAALGFAGIHALGKAPISGLTKDNIILASAGAIRGSAAFGELIIVIVYIPILTLQGIEGKMFIPMAQTVAFALLGALILSLTYVPAACAAFLKPNLNHEKNFSAKLVGFFYKGYSPAVKWSLRHPVLVVAVAFGLFGFATYVLLNMGGEFLPKLEEGDFAVETRAPKGSGPDRMVSMTSKAEKVLLTMPEVKEVVSKIGTSEIPVDPMPVENADLIIVLKDRKDWPNGGNQMDLALKFEEALTAVPGLAFEFQQPIAMRFNELMTGSKSDIALKIYGPDLDSLLSIANRYAGLASKVNGVASVKVEQVDGMPQYVVRYNRVQMANLGISVADANQALKGIMAGENAGMLYDQERRFPIMLRAADSIRLNPEILESIPLRSANGTLVPFSSFSKIEKVNAPSQISHDRARRVITVGIALGNRDVNSVVIDLKAKLIAAGIAPNYNYTFGGQFQNLQDALARLTITVPLALFLILLLLFITFNSIKQSLAVFTAIPLAAIGGVFALSLRGMPFSIAAAVGFIALFGVAVLNGIVLIGYLNKLKKDGVKSVPARIMRAVHSRFRPVLMTALVAALGFLPMALSSSEGAEVQKPLATVVVGGVLTAAILTLIILPALYLLLERQKPTRKQLGKIALVAICLLSFGNLHAQPLTLETAVEKALAHYPAIKVANLQVQATNQETKTWFDIGKTSLETQYGNTQVQGITDYTIILSQSMPWPGVLKSQKKWLQGQAINAQIAKDLTELDLKLTIRHLFTQAAFEQENEILLIKTDSLLSELYRVLQLKAKLGEIPVYHANAAKIQLAQNNVNLTKARGNSALYRQMLGVFIGEPVLSVESTLYTIVALPQDKGITHFKIQQAENQHLVALQQVKTEKQRLLPDLKLGYINQSIEHNAGQQAVIAGIGIPLAYGATKNKAKAAELKAQSLLAETETKKATLEMDKKKAEIDFQNAKQQLDEYSTSIFSESAAIETAALASYKAGESDFSDLFLLIRQSIDVRQAKLDASRNYWQSYFNYLYFNNQ